MIGPARPRTLLQAMGCAWRGLALATRTQANLRIQLVIASGALVAAWLSQFSVLTLSVLAATIGLVLATELLNTAIEMVTDLLHPGDGPRAGAVKDVSAAAVLMASFCAAAVGVFFFWPLISAAHPVARPLPLALAAVFFLAFLVGAIRSAR